MIGKNCRQCGAALFEIAPGETSKLELARFISSSPYYDRGQLVTEAGPVAGTYCPNGCSQEVEEIGDGALWEPIDLSNEEPLLSKVFLLAGGVDIEDYKVYIDGYVRHAQQKDKDENGCLIFDVEAGEHRIVVREWEVKKQNRLESNTAFFSLDEYEAVEFRFSKKGDLINLALLGKSGVSSENN